MSEITNDELLAITRAVALEAGAMIMASAPDRSRSVETKSSLTDVVTEVDRRSERLIVERLLAARPDDGILGEEGASVQGSSGIDWVIDPIDGTTNFLYGHPHFAVSIAARDQGGTGEGITRAGVVLDATTDELYEATHGGGARRNGEAIRCSHPASLAMSLIGTGFSYDSDRRQLQARTLLEVLPRVRDIRRVGAAALDLCSVAAGRLDAYYERGVQDWDVAAGLLIAREAGALIDTSPPMAEGAGPVLVVAAAPTIWEPLRALLNQAAA